LFEDGYSECIQTLRLLNRIDTNIVASYYSQLAQNIPSNLSVAGKNDHALRMLELLEAKSGEDGEFYAQELISLFVQLEGAPSTGTPVLETAVESVLLYLRNGVLTGIFFLTLD
jgi:AP-4 complex subunit epsilon-1